MISVNETGLFAAPNTENSQSNIEVSETRLNMLVNGYESGTQKSLVKVIEELLHDNQPLLNTVLNLWKKSTDHLFREEKKLWSKQIEIFLKTPGNTRILELVPDFVKALQDIQQRASAIEYQEKLKTYDGRASLVDEQYQKLTREVVVKKQEVNGREQVIIFGVSTESDEKSVRHQQQAVEKAFAEVTERIGTPNKALYIIGGAAQTGDGEYEATAPVVVEAIKQFLVANKNVVIVDGATDSGYMKLPNQALSELNPEQRKSVVYVGTAPAENVRGQGLPNLVNLFQTVSNNVDVFPIGDQHDIFTPIASPKEKHKQYGQWEAETNYMMLFDKYIDTILSQKEFEENEKGVVLMMGGGGISLKELMHHLAENRRIVLILGSGRNADVVSILDSIIDTSNLNESRRNIEAKLNEVNPRWRELCVPVDVKSANAVQDIVWLLNGQPEKMAA